MEKLNNMKKAVILFLIITIFASTKLNQLISQDTGLEPPFVITDLSGGLDTDTATGLLPIGVSPDLYNNVLDETSALTKRLGTKLAYTLPVSTDTKFLNSYSAVYDDGSSEFIVHAGSGVYVTSGNDVWTLIVNGISSNSPTQFAMLNGEVWMTG